MKIAIAVNFKKPKAKELAQEVAHYLQQKGVSVVGPESELSEGISEKVDFVLSLGGDGSILALMHKNPQLDAPIIGVNFGTLGFLADISAQNLYRSLDAILDGNYTVQERLMLEGTTSDGASCFAVNELVVHRGSNYNLVDIGLTVNGKYFNTFSADGVIVATPSGSTAYSLSAGGPIVSPELQAVVITPICPHALSNRPIVLHQPDLIEVEYLSDYLPVEVAFDGICRFSLKPKEVLSIRPSTKRFRLVSVPDFDYFATLRTKLNWTGSLRN
ncbi:MAG: NAD(+)/NADH kinase [Verrucomicrobia bacterium]|nr:NAD(+)/NADH kinase [Verrucomicrobiota bacterium]MBS0637859.1 NAD(+)/NADH kinase [Verrucomicrobiota bacterium]